MKSILLISPYWQEQHRWMVSSVKLADLWDRIGYQVNVICMGSKTTPKTKLSIGGKTLEMHKDFFLPDPWNYGICWGFSKHVQRKVEIENPDFIVVNKILFWTSLSLIPLSKKGRKVILITDALVGMTWWPRGWLPKVCALIYAWTFGWLILRHAHKIVFFHPQPPALLERLGISHKSIVIPTGIDSEPFSDANALRKGVEHVTVTYVGRLESVKGVDDFLAAVVPLKKEFPDLRIQVAGWAKPNHPLLKQYSNTNDVSFLGHCTDIAHLLARSHIFVLPSYSEGLSNALMEAMASNCACVASEVGGNRYLIENSKSGFLFPAGDREALRAHVRRLIEDPAKRAMLGEAARKRIEEVFDWKVVGKQYAELFGNSELKIKSEE